jgi:hypothetical protein
MTQVRRRVKHRLTFEERLAEEARRLKEEAEKLPLGSKARDRILRRARQAETASRIDEWLRSPARPPAKLNKLCAGVIRRSGIPSE